MPSLTVGLIGLGWLSREIYLPCLQDSPLVRSVVGYDVNHHVYSALSGQYSKLECAPDLDSAMTAVSDLVIIATPNSMHFDQIKAALGAGRPTLCEKPICLTGAQVGELRELIGRIEVPLLTSVPARFRPDTGALKEMISHGAFGHVYSLRASWIKKSGIPGSDWFRQKSLAGGGVLIDMGPHMIDLLIWLTECGEHKSAHAVGSAHFLRDPSSYASWHRGYVQGDTEDVEDHVVATVLCERACLQVELAWASQVSADEVVLAGLGTRGSFELRTSLGFSTRVRHRVASLRTYVDGSQMSREIEIEDRKAAFRRMIECYIDGAAKRALPTQAGAEACRVMSVVAALYEDIVMLS